MTTLIEALRNGRQIDEDGVEVAVSREAVCTAADELDRQAKEIEGLKADAAFLREDNIILRQQLRRYQEREATMGWNQS